MQYKIPRNVQVEDRIFGPITMRRLIILCIGGGITYVIWLKLSKTYGPEIWGFPVLLGGSMTFALAFLEPLGMKFWKFCLRLLEYMIIPKQLLWDKRFSQDIFFRHIEYLAQKFENMQSKEGASSETLLEEKQRKLQKLKDLTPLLDLDPLHTFSPK